MKEFVVNNKILSINDFKKMIRIKKRYLGCELEIIIMKTARKEKAI